MFDVWVRDTEITTLIIGVSFLMVLPGQLLLCFKAKKRLVKLLPALLLTAAMLTFFLLMKLATDWSAIGYAILAVFAGEMLFCNGIAWGIWAIIRFRQKKKSRNAAAP